MAKRKSKLRRLAAKVASCNAQARAMTVEVNLNQIRNGVVEVGKMRLTPAPSVHPYFYRGPRNVDDATPRKGKVVDGKFRPDRRQAKAFSDAKAAFVKPCEVTSDAAFKHRIDPSYDPEGAAERAADRKAAKAAKKG